MSTVTDVVRYRVTLHQDHDTEDPTSYGYFELHMFDDRWQRQSDQARWLTCRYENGYWGECEEPAAEHPRVLDGDDEPHQFVAQEDLVATVHGGTHGPYGAWYVDEIVTPGAVFEDRADGVLTWRSDKEKKEFFEHMPLECKLSHERFVERLREILKITMEEYTKWANGECYWYEVHEWDPEAEEYSIEVDYPCGGYIGYKWAVEAATELMDVENPKEGVDYEVEEVYG